MKYLLASLLCIFSQNVYNQCPASITGGTNGSKDCIRLTWNAGEVPTPLPNPVSFEGKSYALQGAIGNSADYKFLGSNCSGVLPGTGQTGTLTYGSENCTYSNGVLPVIFGVIHLKQDDGVIINWTTKNEVNNHFFTIERSKDGMSWLEIGTIGGSGTSQIENVYEFWDPNPLNGISYYRIKQVDFDHTFSYSQAVSYQNPYSVTRAVIQYASSNLIIDNYDSHSIFMIRNYSGQLLLSGNLDDGRNTYSLHRFAPGIYIVSVYGVTQRGFRICLP